MAFWSIKLVLIEKNSSSMHREYHDFYAVHVYLRSIRISLQQTQIPARILSKELELSLVKVFLISVSNIQQGIKVIIAYLGILYSCLQVLCNTAEF